MAEVLVLAELNPAGGGVRKTTLEALTAARALGEPSAVVIGAPGTAGGVRDTLADDYLVAPKAEVLAQLVADRSPAAVVIPSSPEGKEIAARLAIKTGSGFLTDVTEITADGTATQVAFAGATIVHSKVTTGTPIYTLRGNSVTPEPAPAAGAEEAVSVSISDRAKLARVVDRVVEQKSNRPELTEASIVVSGGRGVASAENFAIIEALADSLGAAVGASRAAVDSADDRRPLGGAPLDVCRGSTDESEELGEDVGTSGPPTVFDRAHRRTTVGLLMLITFVAFEAMAVGTAMPTAVAELDGMAWYGWPFSAFLVASVVGMVAGGDAGDRRGPRIALPWSVALFAAGLLMAGLAGSMAVFVAGRAVQGLGAGVMIVLVYVIAGQAYEPALRPRLFGAFATAWVIPALVGPVVSGLVTTHASWRLAFLGLVPLIVVGALLVVSAGRSVAAPERPAAAAPARRWFAALTGLGIAALQYAGQRLDVAGLVLAVVGGVALALGLRRLLPAGTARAGRGLPAVVASRGLLAGAFFGMDALLPLTLTSVHGYSPTAAGIPLTAGAIGWAAASNLQGRFPRAPRERLLRAGFALLALGLAGSALAAVPALGGWPAYPFWALAGLGMGLGMPSVGVLLLEQSPEHRRGADSAALQISDVTSSALCVGLAGVLVAAAATGLLPLPAAVTASVGVFTLVALVGVGVAGRAVAPAAGGAPATASTLAPS
jgi:electron transfer flavoprotein alpha subunit/MFS family permease